MTAGTAPAWNAASGPPAREFPWVVIAGGIHAFGGMDKANAELVEFLIGRRVPVHLVAHSVAERYARHPLVTVYRVARPFGSNFLGERLLGRRGASVARRISVECARSRVVANGGSCAWPDVNWVHYVHHAWTPADDGAPLGYRLKNRIASTLARRDEATALRMARCVIANSARTRADLIEHLDVDPARIHTVYLGSDPSWGPPTAAERHAARTSFGHHGDAPVVTFVGALGHDGRKGFDTLWTAWQLLCARPEWDARLLVAGSGNALAHWTRVVKNAGLESRVRLLGFSERVRDVLAATDLLVSPARYETYGLNVQEALCRAVPVLVSGHAGVTERFPADLADFVLSDPESAGELVEGMLRWRTDVVGWRARAGAFGAALRAYTWRDMARDLVTVVDTTADVDADTAFGRGPW